MDTNENETPIKMEEVAIEEVAMDEIEVEAIIENEKSEAIAEFQLEETKATEEVAETETPTETLIEMPIETPVEVAIEEATLTETPVSEPEIVVLTATESQVNDILNESGLNWAVRKEELVSISGIKTPNVGIFRNDTNEWLGTVSGKYTPYQNKDLVTTIVEASHHVGLEIAKGGTLNKGQKVFIQMELKPEFIGASEVKRYITALNGHNGRCSIAFGSTNTVVACENTFYKIYRELQKFRHHSTAAERVKLAAMELSNTINEDVKLMETFKLMSSIKTTDEVISNVMNDCFDIDMDANPETLSSRKLTRFNKITGAIETERKLEGDTLWGLFNGITRFTNHDSDRKMSKEDYIMMGGGYGLNLTAFQTILTWIEKNTAKEVLIGM